MPELKVLHKCLATPFRTTGAGRIPKRSSTHDAETQQGQWLELATAGQAVRYLRVVTTASPSWVGWNEVEAYGTPVGGEASQVEWVVADQLGTPRMVIDESGGLSGVKRHDYLPFGEEIQLGIGGRTTNQGYGIADGVEQHFTGKLRDDETGLDYFGARYYAILLPGT